MKQEIIRLGSACNQKCIFCNQEEIFDKKSKKHILYELLSFKRKGITALVISGGEPTLFQDELFFTILTGKKIGFEQIELQSNAVLLSNYSYVERLYKLGLDSAMISLHSFNEEVSDNLTKVNGTFNKTLIGIKFLIEFGISTSLNIVINRKNYKTITDYLKYIKYNILGFTDISLSIVIPGKLTKENKLLPKYEEIAPFLIKAYDYCLENNINFDNPGGGIPVCYIKDYYKYSLEYEDFKSGDTSLEFILDKNRSNKIKSEKCRKCVFDKYCLGLWKGYVNLYGFDGVKPIINILKNE